jgi:hypothetical protein
MADELDDLARSLRQGAGREMREEAAVDEQLTELQRLRRRDLAEAVRAAMHRGDTVTVETAGLTLGHRLVAVGADYLTMDDGEYLIDVALSGAVVTTTPSRQGGTTGKAASITLRARLGEHEHDGSLVDVVTSTGASFRGRITVVATDHVVVADGSGRDTLVPTSRIAVVFSRRPPPRS